MSGNPPRGEGSEALDVWETFWTSLPHEAVPTLGMIYGSAIQLLSDAVRSFDAGAIRSAVLTCRAAVESACFMALVSFRVGHSMWGINLPRDLAGQYRFPEFTELKAGVVNRDILSSALVTELERIQRDGNSVAHMASRQTVSLVRFATTPAHQRDESFSLSVSREVALTDIRGAISIVRAIVTWSQERQVIRPPSAPY